uniref:Potassium channel toxin alpha-KTx 16.6 n=1 Tax=Buthus israelis TaxID=2899555 RepID=KA166_BUTIS|nr:RecName: Full=Potassium channel toxin alpha-KTx 16.6; AltName: Full=Toxin Tx608; Flags: Precursor [Buthus occitanus israelis]ACJ23151.1 putative potassium channel toxin Tx608 [Buthus occitanus israelis]
MKILSVLLIALIICSINICSEAGLIDVRCYASRECWEPCRRVTGSAQAKCQNNQCRCY